MTRSPWSWQAHRMACAWARAWRVRVRVHGACHTRARTRACSARAVRVCSAWHLRLDGGHEVVQADECFVGQLLSPAEHRALVLGVLHLQGWSRRTRCR